MGYLGIYGKGKPYGGGYRYGGRTPDKGTATRATSKKFRKDVKEVVKDTEDMVKGPLTKLLGDQTGEDGFTLKNLDYVSGTASGTAKLIKIKTKDNETYYIPAYPSYT